MRLLTNNTKITNVSEGEYVLSRNIESGMDEYNFVKATMRPFVPSTNQIQIMLENGTSVITSTIHPTLVFRNEIWDYVDAEHLVVGDICWTNTEKSTITKLRPANITPEFADFSVDVTENYYAGKNPDKMMVVHNSATLHYPIWHYEVEDLLVLKNNKGTDDNRVRHIDYSVQFCKLFYERLIKNEDITLFSPSDVPGLYESFFNDQVKFKELYERAEKNNYIRKKRVNATELFSSFMEERKNTGRIYLMNVDNVNEHSPFKPDVAAVRMSNLCLVADTKITVKCDNEIFSIEIHEVDKFIKKYETVLVKSYNTKTNTVEFQSITAFGMTNPDAELYKVETDDGMQSVVCTGDHLFWTENRGYVAARELTETDVLLSFLDIKDNVGY